MSRCAQKSRRCGHSRAFTPSQDVVCALSLPFATASCACTAGYGSALPPSTSMAATARRRANRNGHGTAGRQTELTGSRTGARPQASACMSSAGGSCRGGNLLSARCAGQAIALSVMLWRCTSVVSASPLEATANRLRGLARPPRPPRHAPLPRAHWCSWVVVGGRIFSARHRAEPPGVEPAAVATMCMAARSLTLLHAPKGPIVLKLGSGQGAALARLRPVHRGAA